LATPQGGVTGACVGVVVGLVVATPTCGYVTMGGAFMTGITGAVVCNLISVAVRRISWLDDQLEVFAAHGTHLHDRPPALQDADQGIGVSGVGGVVGMLMLGLFASKDENADGDWGLVHGHAQLFYKSLVSFEATSHGYPCAMRRRTRGDVA
jgi:ammonium transporter, Amt family